MQQTHKKLNQISVKDKRDKQKHKFFEQVYKQCSQIFSSKQFQFFIKCMIPNSTLNNRKSSTHRRSENSNKNEQKQHNIQDINPHVLTMPRKYNYFEQRNVDKIQIQKKNKRILTTPTEKTRKQVKFQNYEHFQLHKRMKKYQQYLSQRNCNVGHTNNSKSKNINLYCPQPLFYNTNHIKIAKPLFVLKSNQKNYKKEKNYLSRHMNFSTNSKMQNKQNTDSQLIPNDFVQILKLPNKNSYGHRFSRTGYMKSTRSNI